MRHRNAHRLPMRAAVKAHARNVFDRSHTYKTTFNCDELIPFYVDEVSPNEHFSLRMTAFGRSATPEFPIMDNLFFTTFFFCIPYRLVWDNFKKFQGEQDNPDDSTDYITPYVMFNDANPVQSLSLFDYMGLPPSNVGYGSTSDPKNGINSLFFRAYNLVWNEHFRDENLQVSVSVPKTDGPDDPADFVVLKRGKRYDYFTSSLPWPQKGFSVTTPIEGQAPIIGQSPVLGIGVNSGAITTTPTPFNQSDGNIVSDVGWSTGSTVYRMAENPDNLSFPNIRADADALNSTMQADLSMATGVSINQLRESIALQAFFENDAVGSTRYKDMIYARFGSVSSDKSLQRSEYIGGRSSMVHFHPVVQTSASAYGAGEANTPQGNTGAFATLSVKGHGFSYHFEEHSVVLGLMCVDAELTYQQGIHRMWTRRTRYDYPAPEFANLGEQEVYNREVYAYSNDDSIHNGIFGYQRRYQEEKGKPSLITGLFRSVLRDTTYFPSSTSLDVWHLSQYFTSLPTLNSEFIECNTPFDRVIAVADEPHFIFDSFLSIRAVKPLPVYSIPATLDRF